MTAEPNQIIERARAALRGVYDPEIGIDIVALGLVYDVRLEGSRLEVDMTLTTDGCPVAESLPNEAADAVAGALSDVDLEVAVRLVWDPPWSPR
ncbi:MAG: metal-sulfur cluster assembly factor [Acidimicrobiia bacterium]|nr:metal-sulfur cluster assembly factor [Acidimicrobiia bacterium]